MVLGRLIGHGGYPDVRAPETALGAYFFTRGVPLSLASLPGVPASVQTLIANHQATAEPPADAATAGPSIDAFSPLPMEIARQFRADSAEAAGPEPSWSALAYLLEEEQFLQVWHYLADTPQMRGILVHRTLIVSCRW